jgi:hypothetical protein
MTARIVLSTAILALLFSCASRQAIRQHSLPKLNSLPDRNAAGFEADGLCDVWLRAGKLRTRARVALKGDTVSVALIDELGVPLEQVVTDSANVNVVRMFPPMNRETAERTGLLLRAYALAANKQYENADTYDAHLSSKYSMKVSAQAAGPDSLHVFTGAANPVYRCLFKENEFYALQQSDTVMVFAIQ